MKYIKPVISSLIISGMAYGLFLYAAPVNTDSKPVTSASAPVIVPNAATIAVTSAETATVTTSVTTTVSTTAPVTTTPEQTTVVTTTAETTVTEPEHEESPVQGVINGEMLYDTEYVEYQLPDNPDYHGFKSYEPYDLITAQSVQLCLQQEAVTDVNGFRLLDNRYLVAVGTFCNAPCGTYIDLILENGVLIPALSAILRPMFIQMKRILIPWLRCARVSLLLMIRYARLHGTGMFQWCMRSGGVR